MRRAYILGRCQDCGHTRRITWITFWVNGYRMRICAGCIRAYRAVILTGETRARMQGRST